MTPKWVQKLAEREAICRNEPASNAQSHSFSFRLVALMYTVFFFIEPFQRHNLPYWLWFALVYIVFIALFLGIPYTRGKLRLFLFAILFLLGFVYVPFNQSASGLFVYPMALLPFWLKDGRRVFLILTLQIAAIVTEGLWLNLSPWSFLMGSFFSVVVTTSNLFFMFRSEALKKLHVAHDEIERLAKTAERERIARDLHDVLGHTLTLIVLKSQVAEQMIAADPQKAAQEVTEIQVTARKALAEVREAVLGFRSDGLEAELERATQTLASAGIECRQQIEPAALFHLLNREQEVVLALSVREAVTNIMRHSEAKNCVLHLRVTSDRVHVVMSDDGRGGKAEGGFGLRGMRERVEMLGGSLVIDGAKGMKLVIELPLQERLA